MSKAIYKMLENGAERFYKESVKPRDLDSVEAVIRRICGDERPAFPLQIWV